MKNATVVMVLFCLSFAFSLQAQSRKTSKSTVKKVSNIPVYLYADPETSYREVGTIKATMSFVIAGMSDAPDLSFTTKELLNKAKRKVKKGKMKSFNAMIIDPDDFSGMLVNLKDPSNNIATVNKIQGVPVYLYSEPNKSYKKVKTISATWSNLTGVESIKEMVYELVKKAKKQEQSGKIKSFDAIIIQPNSFKGTLVKFN